MDESQGLEMIRVHLVYLSTLSRLYRTFANHYQQRLSASYLARSNASDRFSYLAMNA